MTVAYKATGCTLDQALDFFHSAKDASRGARIPHPGRLRIVHSSLQPGTPSRGPRILQPAGWGYFTLAYSQRRKPWRQNPPTGRLGIFHSSLQKRLADFASGILHLEGWWI